MSHSVPVHPFSRSGELAPVLIGYWALVGQRTHRTLAYLFAGLIALHIIGALKHHFIDRDKTPLRMLGRS